MPYRDSKLTYILKDSLGGDSKTAMLATISPSEVNYEETVSTLRYASSVKRIKTSASQHLEQEAGEMIEKLKAEVDALATELKNQEIQAEALADEHRRALAELEKSRPVKVVRDDKEIAKLKADLTAMSKRAERYRTERDSHKGNFESMEKRADRYRQERKASDEKLKEANKALAKAEKELAASSKAGARVPTGSTPPASPPPAAAAEGSGATNAEVVLLLKRVKELEELVSNNAGMGDDMQSAIKQRRDTGTHLNRMSMELEQTAAEKKKLEDKLKKKNAEMRDPLAVMSMGFSSMFGAVTGGVEEGKEGAENGSDGSSDEKEGEASDEDIGEASSATGSLGASSGTGGVPNLNRRAMSSGKMRRVVFNADDASEETWLWRP